MTDAPSRPAPLAVGDTVFIRWDSVHRRGSGDLFETKIMKLGRRWVTVYDGSAYHDGYRFDRETLASDRDHRWTPPGTLYRSREHWGEHAKILEERAAVRNGWQILRKHILGKHAPPDGVTRAQIAAALAALGVKTETKEGNAP
jgi:hypothetical protein